MAASVLHRSIEESKLSLRKLTVKEYHKLGEAGILHPNDRVELIDGLLVQMALSVPNINSSSKYSTTSSVSRKGAGSK
jgi:hypothetical protein